MRAFASALVVLFAACAPAPPAQPYIPKDGVRMAEVYFYKVINIAEYKGRFYGVPLAELPPHGNLEAVKIEARSYAHLFEGGTPAEVKAAVRRFVLADNTVPELVWK